MTIGVFLLGVLIDYNRISPHYFYRDRLAETYLRTEATRPSRGGAGSARLELIRNDEQIALGDLHGRLGNVARSGSMEPNSGATSKSTADRAAAMGAALDRIETLAQQAYQAADPTPATEEAFGVARAQWGLVDARLPEPRRRPGTLCSGRSTCCAKCSARPPQLIA